MKQYVQTDLEADRRVANTLAGLIVGGALVSKEIGTGQGATRAGARAQIRAPTSSRRPFLCFEKGPLAWWQGEIEPPTSGVVSHTTHVSGVSGRLSRAW
jgi:hypothetical protein